MELGKNILAIGGHVGDMELTAGGVLATCAARGGKITTLALTAGEKGVPPGQTVETYRAQKLREAEAFAGMLGGEAIVLDYPDGLLPDNDEVRFQVCDIIRRVKPDTIITHHHTSMHKDHMACRRIADDARFYAAVPGFGRDLPEHGVKNMLYAENWEDAPGFKPYQYFDITEGFEAWQKGLQTHWFIMNSKSFPYYEYYVTLSRLRGIEARRERAEAFMVPHEVHRVVQDV